MTERLPRLIFCRNATSNCHVMAALASVGEIGWGGRIRTFTVLINSEVSYQLDHAPAVCRGPWLAVSRAE